MTEEATREEMRGGVVAVLKKVCLHVCIGVITIRARMVERSIVKDDVDSPRRDERLYQLNTLTRAKYDLRQRLKRG